MARTVRTWFGALLLTLAAATPGLYGQDAASLNRKPDVMFYPTPQEVVERMLELAEVKPTDVVYDLGCGDGRIVVTAARKYGARGLGTDIDPRCVKHAQDYVRESHVSHLVKIEEKDIFTQDLRGASVVALYLQPHLNVRLIPQLDKLKPGSRIVSHNFDMKGVTPQKVVHFLCHYDGKEHTLYLWTTPLKKEPATPAARH